MTATVTRLTLLRHAPTSATRRAAFAHDESLEATATRAVVALAPRLGRFDAAWSGPAACARETVAALGLTVTVAGALDDADPGAWRGRTIDEVERFDRARLAAWMTDPAVPPPGGESVLDVMARVGRWLDERSNEGHTVLAVTHAIVIRAAVAHALLAPPSAVWRIDVAPLSRTILHAGGGRWTVRALNVGPAEVPGD